MPTGNSLGEKSLVTACEPMRRVAWLAWSDGDPVGLLCRSGTKSFLRKTDYKVGQRILLIQEKDLGQKMNHSTVGLSGLIQS